MQSLADLRVTIDTL